LKAETRKLLDKSAHAIRAARLLLDNAEVESAASRAYYAMFYVAEACEDDRRGGSHSGVHSLFGELFAKPGRLDSKYHRWTLDAFDRRIQGDYRFDVALSLERVHETIEQASEFLATAEAFLSGGG
jgi:uncharacterized protein (UPF0332 family)